MMKIHRDTCVVSFNLKGVDPDPKLCETSSSGIIIDPRNGLVICHASILMPFFMKEKKFTQVLLSSGSINVEKDKIGLILSDLEANILLEKISTKTERLENVRFFTALLNYVSGNRHDVKYNKLKGSLKYIWKAHNFAQALGKLLPKSENWHFSQEKSDGNNNNVTDEDSENNNENIDKMLTLLLPYFILLKISNWKQDGPGVLDICLPHKLRTQQRVWAMGTPFGNLSPDVFMNSVSSGIISNLAGSNNEIILTDARCIPGAEGGAIYVGQDLDRSKLAGMVVAPLCWKANEWIGLTIACSISELISSLRNPTRPVHVSPVSGLSQDVHDTTGQAMSKTLENVVMVRCGNSWGSGVLLPDRQMVVTCSHVVKFSPNTTVAVRLWPSYEWIEANVVYCTKQGEVLDVAILKVHESDQIYVSGRSTPKLSDQCHVGKEVVVVGYPVFGPELDLSPTVTAGVIAKVVTMENVPVMIQTTSCVQAGVSGGPLVSKDGTVIGIVTCNARDDHLDASYPHVNLAVPMGFIMFALDEYEQTNDEDVFSCLWIENKAIKRLWSMQSLEMEENISSKL